MRKDTLSENLTKLNTLLIKAVQVPYKALEHDLILKVSKKSTKGGRCKLITDDNAGWTFALEVLIQVLIFFAAGKCNDLSSNIGAKLGVDVDIENSTSQQQHWRKASAGWCCSQCQHLLQAGSS